MASNKLRLEGKVAIITGGSSGIGETTARLFASNGAAVVIADINDSLGQLVANSISPPCRCTFVHCDVRDEHHLTAVVDHAITTYGRLDIFFSNAGVVGTTSSVLDLDPADLDYVLAVHVRGTALAIKHAGRVMVAAGTRGSIICTGLAKAAAVELGEKGVRVNCVSPFLLATPLSCKAHGSDAGKVEEISSAAANLKGKVLRTDDVAAAVLFLASDESGFISGHNLIIDGGVTVMNTTLPEYAKKLSDENGK